MVFVTYPSTDSSQQLKERMEIAISSFGGKSNKRIVGCIINKVGAPIEEKDKAIQGRPEGQKILAQEVTRLVHGEAGLDSAQRITEALFSGDLSSLSESDLAQLAQDGLPTTEVEGAEKSLIELLTSCDLAKSNKMAREFVKNGAVSINGTKEADSDIVLKQTDALFGKYTLIKRGKRLFNLFIWK
jgi:tyrosyl-tRNA synthetase